MEILNQRVIKMYSPGVYHVVVDAKIIKDNLTHLLIFNNLKILYNL